MEWTDIRITVPKARAEEAEAIATGISGGGIYIEDYSDLETQVEAIAHVDLIEQDLLDKPRDQVIVHMYPAGRSMRPAAPCCAWTRAWPSAPAPTRPRPCA